MEYTIGKVAEIVGISSYTLRYYEKEGLLPEIKRNDKGIRIYSDDDIFWIDLIRCLRATGMPIAEIYNIVQLSFKGEKTIPERKQILITHREKLEKQIKEIHQYINKIDRKLEWYDGKRKCCRNNTKNS